MAPWPDLLTTALHDLLNFAGTQYCGVNCSTAPHHKHGMFEAVEAQSFMPEGTRAVRLVAAGAEGSLLDCMPSTCALCSGAC